MCDNVRVQRNSNRAMEIRLAHKIDAQDIAILLEQLGYPSKKCEIEMRLDLYPKRVAVATLNDRVVGLIVWEKHALFVVDKTRFRIEALVVDKHSRGKGIGRQLMLFVESIAQEEAPAVIELTSGKHRLSSGAHTFYHTLGYTDGNKIYLRKELAKKTKTLL